MAQVFNLCWRRLSLAATFLLVLIAKRLQKTYRTLMGLEGESNPCNKLQQAEGALD